MKYKKNFATVIHIVNSVMVVLTVGAWPILMLGVCQPSYSTQLSVAISFGLMNYIAILLFLLSGLLQMCCRRLLPYYLLFGAFIVPFWLFFHFYSSWFFIAPEENIGPQNRSLPKLPILALH